MSNQTIAEIYQGNANVRFKLKEVVANLTDEQLIFRPTEKDWNIREIVEHLAIVENGMTKICAKLLQESAAENITNDGDAVLSQNGQTASVLIKDRVSRKVQAPDRVVPSGNLSIAESFAKMEENAQLLQQIKNGLETVNTNKHTFPHPFFGDLTATDWLVLLGGHEARHIEQIEEILGNYKS